MNESSDTSRSRTREFLPVLRSTSTVEWAAFYALLGWPLVRDATSAPDTVVDGITSDRNSSAGRTAGMPDILPTNQVASDFDSHPETAVKALCVHFDALAFALSRDASRDLMLRLDNAVPPPALFTGPENVLTVLVAPGTGAGLIELNAEAIRIRSGGTEWTALPPTGGAAWDTPAWDLRTGEPRELPRGQDLVASLRRTLRLYSIGNPHG